MAQKRFEMPGRNRHDPARCLGVAGSRRVRCKRKDCESEISRLFGSPTVTDCEPAGRDRRRSGSGSSTSARSARTAFRRPSCTNRPSRSRWGPRGRSRTGAWASSSGASPPTGSSTSWPMPGGRPDHSGSPRHRGSLSSSAKPRSGGGRSTPGRSGIRQTSLGGRESQGLASPRLWRYLGWPLRFSSASSRCRRSPAGRRSQSVSMVPALLCASCESRHQATCVFPKSALHKATAVSVPIPRRLAGRPLSSSQSWL